MSRPFAEPSLPAIASLAIEVGACVRPVLQRLTDTMTGETRIVPIPCGATLASSCPSCAERNRKLRMQQCREGWHLDDDPFPPDEDDHDGAVGDESDGPDEDDDNSRRTRSTRRRQDVPDLPRKPIEARSIGDTFETPSGKSYRPSTFLTVTMRSYGPVREDGTPVDPDRYDYLGQALDALHMPKLWDRFVQNLRRAAGFRAQYFAAVEPQRRLAPHVHAAVRGAIARKTIRQVVHATYHQLWWPHFDRPVYTDPTRLPVYGENADGFACYLDPDTLSPLLTWDEALDELDAEPEAGPAYVIRFGKQLDIQGLIAGPKAERRIGYLTKYLAKSIAEGAAPAGELTERQKAHADRLYEHVRLLPCSPECVNWLRYGITPKSPVPGMIPGQCDKRAHHRARLGCGGRRVLVSRYWTGKTLTEHAADRLGAVRAALDAAGIELPAGCSATDLRPDGEPRYQWESVDRDDVDAITQRQAVIDLIAQRVEWREQYEQARDGSDPPSTHSATASTPGEAAA
jgi:hypothetical protein